MKPHNQRQEDIIPFRLRRREVLEELLRQGVCRLSKIKSECRRFELYWETRIAA
jgi:hypothetical protein